MAEHVKVDDVMKYDPAKDERLARYMALVTPLGYASALDVVNSMTALMNVEARANEIAGRARAEEREKADREPVDIQIASRKGGKHSTLADMIVERANAKGIRVEFVNPDRVPSDAAVVTVAHHMAHAASDWTDTESGGHWHSPECANGEAYEDDARAALISAQEVRDAD